MTPQELFRAGRLAEAIEAQNAAVRARPTDDDARSSLFVLLAFAGDLERAEKQLDVLARGDERTAGGSLAYRRLILAEAHRRAVFEDGERPLLPPEPPEYVEARLRALECARAGDLEGAEKQVDEAVAVTPALAGRLDGEPFDAIRDYDDLLGSVLEVFAGGRYLWLPFERIRRLELEAPSGSLDLLWAPASLEDADGETARVHVPVLYAGSHAHADEAVRLGRSTQWDESSGQFRGSGQRLLLVGAGGETLERAFLEVRTLELGADS